MKLTLSNTDTTGSEYWTSAEPINPTTLIKRFDSNGKLQSAMLYNTEGELIHNFRYSRKAFTKMTDSVTDTVRKVSNIYSFMDITLAA